MLRVQLPEAFLISHQMDKGWKSANSPATVARQRRIADALLETLAGCTEAVLPGEFTWLELRVPGIEIAIHDIYIHMRIRWRSVVDHRRLRLTENLRAIADIANNLAGYDFYEHGECSLGVRTDIDGTAERVARFGLTTSR